MRESLAYSFGGLVISFIATILIVESIIPYHQITPRAQPCAKLSQRREWRTLDESEQEAFIEAVLCLANTPSPTRTLGTLYDDFAYVHMEVGSQAHYSAPFFPWHRVFLHLFERRLKDTCGYRGSLPYWDWTLDRQSLADSPVWDNHRGFGGDGDDRSAQPFSDGSSCIADGPFRDMKVLYNGSQVSPHCLARGFRHYEAKSHGSISSVHLQPDVMNELLNQNHYDSFRNMTEYTVHNALHWGLSGDFVQWTSANDPIFYLHHAQIDRLWWMWQQKRPERRIEYYGKGSRASFTPASIQDDLHFLELGPSIDVLQTMQTDAAPFCYNY